MKPPKPTVPERAELTVPGGCEVYNFLYRTRDPEYLVQDQLTVALPNGFFIDTTRPESTSFECSTSTGTINDLGRSPLAILMRS